ncbi:MAG: hypothetical protein EPO26_13165 [Chloroflexota bacterium]|nr:MAG: hypothetical protein EPO26_13165 [Chloroflexota bacterium]
MSSGRALGLIEHLAPSGATTHSYRVRVSPSDPYKTLCGRQLTAGTSRGHVWRDLGPVDRADALAAITCRECLAVARRATDS